MCLLVGVGRSVTNSQPTKPGVLVGVQYVSRSICWCWIKSLVGVGVSISWSVSWCVSWCVGRCIVSELELLY